MLAFPAGDKQPHIWWLAFKWLLRPRGLGQCETLSLLQALLSEMGVLLVVGPEGEPRRAIPLRDQHGAGQRPGKIPYSKSGRGGNRCCVWLVAGLGCVPPYCCSAILAPLAAAVVVLAQLVLWCKKISLRRCCATYPFPSCPSCMRSAPT